MSVKVLNSYYLYYKNVLKNKNLPNDQLKLEMQNKFGENNLIEIRDWGRTTSFKSLNIRKGESEEYVIPLQSPEEILSLSKTFGEKLLEDYNWVIPPYIQKRIINEMIKITKIDDVEILYKSTYTPIYFASQLTSTYREITLFQKYISLVEEAIGCFLLGKTAAAITLLLTILEGIAREFCDEHSLLYNKHGSSSAFETSIKYRKKTWRDNVLLYDYENKINQILPSDYMNDELLIKADEAMDMFVSFEKYGLDYLYKSGSDFTLNRHSILHGYNRDYYIPLNFYRLFSCLEMLSVVVSNNFMPKESDQHEETLKILSRFQVLGNLRRFFK
ncbi:hypothetical protein [Terribacillus saccharophilus]|uniref:hypothetical protein n=1 Tax=Terribacillus saccharophilus TaxID=361277 RepID=UPI003982B3C9